MPENRPNVNTEARVNDMASTGESRDALANGANEWTAMVLRHFKHE
jgi:hypothetical protein